MDRRREAGLVAPERVRPLAEVPGFRGAAGDPDVRGWEVVALAGERVGRVHELLVDAAAGRVRYLDVALAAGPGAAGEEEGAVDPFVTAMMTAAATPGVGIVPILGPAGAPPLDPVLGQPDLGEAPAAASVPGATGAGESGRHVLVPVGRARLDRGHHEVRLDLRPVDLLELPEYRHGALDPDMEAELERRFQGAADLYDERRFYGRD
jgi:PRC-barrel domain protein